MHSVIDLPASGARDAAPANRVSLATIAHLLRLPPAETESVPDLHFPMRRVAAGAALFHAGQPFASLYVVRSGSFKTVVTAPRGAERVLGFAMPGDVIGVDGIDSGSHPTSAYALHAAQVVVISYHRVAWLARQCRHTTYLIHRVLGRGLARAVNLIAVLGTRGADALVATFLLDVGERMGRLGYSRTAFVLRMTRQDIGSHLGLSLETVSRAFSRLKAAGIIETHSSSRDITILDEAALRGMACGPDADSPRSVAAP